MPAEKYVRVERKFIGDIRVVSDLEDGHVARPRKGEHWFAYPLKATEAEVKAAPGVSFIKRYGDALKAINVARDLYAVVACDAEDHLLRVTHVIQQRVK